MSDAGDIAIRALSAEDAAQWRRLRLEALRTHPTAFAFSYEEAAQQDLAGFAASIPPPGGADALFGAFHGDILSGSAGVHVYPRLKQRHKGQLWGVYVDPSLRGRGVGAALVHTAVAHARTRVEVLQLSVQYDNVAARALYRKLGFVPYGIERRALRHEGKDYDDELMAMDLGHSA
jgi:ribosomal protein S18 acetylase RimI-like enzyme